MLGLCLCVLAGAYLALCIGTHETPVVAKCALIKAFDAKTDVAKVPCPQDTTAKLRAIVKAKEGNVAATFKGECYQAKCFVNAYFSGVKQAKKVDTDAKGASIKYEGAHAVVCGPSSGPKDVVIDELKDAAEAGVNRTCFFFPETKRHKTRVVLKDPGETFKKDLIQGWELFLVGIVLMFFFEIWAWCRVFLFPCLLCCGCENSGEDDVESGAPKTA